MAECTVYEIEKQLHDPSQSAAALGMSRMLEVLGLSSSTEQHEEKIKWHNSASLHLRRSELSTKLEL